MMTRRVLLSLMWSLAGLFLIVGYFLFIFMRHWADELFAEEYGPVTYTKGILTAAIAQLYLAIPYVVLIFSMSFFRELNIKPGRTIVIATAIILGLLTFWWIGYGNPSHQRRFMSFFLDIRQKQLPENFGSYDNLMDSPTTVSFSRINELSDEEFKEEVKIRNEIIEVAEQNLSRPQLDSLLKTNEFKKAGFGQSDFDQTKLRETKNGHQYILRARVLIEQVRFHHDNFKRYNQEKYRILSYAVIVVLMFLLGIMIADRLQKMHFAILLFVVLLGLFPCLTIVEEIADKLFRQGALPLWFAIGVVPFILVLLLVLLNFVKRKSQRECMN